VTIRPYSTIPSIDSFTPTVGPVGTTVDILGANFTNATNVTFNGTNAAYSVASDSKIHAFVPPGATTGPISVMTPSGTATSTSRFTVIPPPTISGFAPAAGPVGTTVSITGQNLTTATSVTFNGAAARFTAVSPTLITTSVPSGTMSGAISVTTLGGTATTTSSFTVIPPPTITGFSPTGGPVGRQVALTGVNFTNVTAVRLGAASAKFTLTSATELRAVVPTIGRGYYKWSVTTAAGTATSTGSFRVR
jgi:hypothetical protein